MVNELQVNHVSELCRILVIEDNEERIELFKRWLPASVHPVFARSPGRALEIVRLDAGTVYSGVALDHDLNEQIVSPEELGFSGTDVVQRIARCLPNEVPVLIHSMNFDRAASMRRLLTAHGFYITRIPFRDLDETKLLEWIDDVQDLWKQRQEE